MLIDQSTANALLAKLPDATLAKILDKIPVRTITASVSFGGEFREITKSAIDLDALKALVQEIQPGATFDSFITNAPPSPEALQKFKDEVLAFSTILKTEKP